jgi:hypothetical protein
MFIFIDSFLFITPSSGPGLHHTRDFFSAEFYSEQSILLQLAFLHYGFRRTLTLFTV